MDMDICMEEPSDRSQQAEDEIASSAATTTTTTNAVPANSSANMSFDQQQQKDPTTRLNELNAEIAASDQMKLQRQKEIDMDMQSEEEIQSKSDDSIAVDGSHSDLVADITNKNKSDEEGTTITLLSDSEEESDMTQNQVVIKPSESKIQEDVLMPGATPPELNRKSIIEEQKSSITITPINATQESEDDVIMLDDDDDQPIAIEKPPSPIQKLSKEPDETKEPEETNEPERNKEAGASESSEIQSAVNSILEDDLSDNKHLEGKPSGEKSSENKCPEDKLSIDKPSGDQIDVDKPSEVKSLEDTSFVSSTVQSRECINYNCPKKSKQFVKCSSFVINHFRVNPKTRAQYVCEECFNECIEKYSELCGVLQDQQPLLLESMPIQPVLVEIIDSSDEDEDSDSSKSSTRDMVPRDVLKLLEKDLINVLNDTLNRVNINSQMSWTNSILDNKIAKNKLISDSIADDLSYFQQQGDKMFKRLYSTTGCIIKELPPFDLNNEPSKLYGPDYPPEGKIEYPEPNTTSLYYAVRQNMMAAWMTCKVIEVIDPTTSAAKRKQYKVKFTRNKGISQKVVLGTQIAYGVQPSVRLTVGVRVIALFHQEDSNQRNHFYPGVIAEPLQSYNAWRYLVFFDDGYAQYVSPDNVRLVCETSARVWDDVHVDSASFIKNYISQYNEQRPMVQVKSGQRMVTEWHGKWLPARVQQIDASLVQMYFEDGKRTEWIYRGSTRLFPLFSKQVQKHSGGGLTKRNEPYVEYINVPDNAKQQRGAQQQSGANIEQRAAQIGNDLSAPPKPRTEEVKRANVAKKSTTARPAPVPTVQHMNNSTIYVDEDNRPKGKVVYYTAKKHMPPRKYVNHECNPKCLYEVKHNLKSYSPLAKPLLSGWERQICKGRHKKLVIYRAPCGRRLRNMQELHTYLRLTNCSLNVDNFDFDYLIHCLAEYVIDSCIVQKADLSDGREQMVVPSVNYYDNTTPPPCVYSEKRIPNKGVPLNLDPDFLCGCDCEDDCLDKSKCQCWKLTLDGATFNNPSVVPEEVGYEYKRLPDSVPTGIYECNSRCKCSKSCLNRVAQQPLQLKLQVFKTGNRGWGLRCLNDVPKGSFVCVYAGDLLTEQNANEAGDHFGDEYFAELDYIEVVESLKEGYEPEAVKDDEDIDDDEYNRRDEDSGDEEFIGRRPSDAHSKQTRYNTRTRNNQEDNVRSKTAQPATGKDDDCSDEEEERQRISFMPDANTEQPATSSFKSIRKAFGKDEAVYIMDAKKTGNIGRYFNHSCAPNLFVQNVFVDTHDLRFPWVAFFALSHIRAGTELTWNYNYDVGSVPGKVLFCECGASTCRGRLL